MGDRASRPPFNACIADVTPPSAYNFPSFVKSPVSYSLPQRVTQISYTRDGVSPAEPVKCRAFRAGF